MYIYIISTGSCSENAVRHSHFWYMDTTINSNYIDTEVQKSLERHRQVEHNPISNHACQMDSKEQMFDQPPRKSVLFSSASYIIAVTHVLS